jgi:hypothetical protein
LARSRETKIELTAYDDLFQTDESREEAKLSIQCALLGVQQTLNLVDEPCLPITGGNKPFGIFRLRVWRKICRISRKWYA